MAVTRRTVFGEAIAGLVAAAVALFGGVWLAGYLDGGPEVDGEVLLDEPGIYQQPTDAVNPDVAGEAVPEEGLQDAAGVAVNLADYRGEPLVVNLWFSRCAPCQRELLDFADVHAEVGDSVRFIGVDPFDTVSGGDPPLRLLGLTRGVGLPVGLLGLQNWDVGGAVGVRLGDAAAGRGSV